MTSGREGVRHFIRTELTLPQSHVDAKFNN